MPAILALFHVGSNLFEHEMKHGPPQEDEHEQARKHGDHARHAIATTWASPGIGHFAMRNFARAIPRIAIMVTVANDRTDGRTSATSMSILVRLSAHVGAHFPSIQTHNQPAFLIGMR